MQSSEVRYIDLFCGLGAFHTAFDRVNILKQNSIKYVCVFACDINKDIQMLYKENYDIEPHGDINKLDISNIPDFNILCAGFPCQSFSVAGKKKGFMDQKNGNLFYRILDIVDVKRPSVILMENVKNLYTVNKGETFDFIRRELEQRGYHVSFKIIDSKYYNCPQSRQRLFIICKTDTPYVFRDIKNPLIPVSQIIDNDVRDFFDYKMKYKLIKCDKATRMKYKLINKDTGRGGRQGERVYDINQCGPTICASSGGPGSNTGLYDFNGSIRSLTVKETIRMFGFDESYKYESVSNKKMLSFLGNSIVVNVLQELILDLK
jgi:DNA (cytosine-5)-methyltransferase 1